MPLKASIGRPAGFRAVFTISGVTAPTRTTFATRDVPWRAIDRTTSPAPVEQPTGTASWTSRSSTSALRPAAHVAAPLPDRRELDPPCPRPAEAKHRYP